MTHAFRQLFGGTVEQHDPWDAAYRTAGPQYTGSAARQHAQRLQATCSYRQSFLHTEEVTRCGGDDKQFDCATD